MTGGVVIFTSTTDQEAISLIILLLSSNAWSLVNAVVGWSSICHAPRLSELLVYGGVFILGKRAALKR